VTDLRLYERGLRTAVACWTAYARTISGGSVHRLPGVDVAVFTAGPERDVFNNAVLHHGLAAPERRAAIEAMAETYADAGVTAYAAWVHDDDTPMLDDLAERGFTHQETTWAMGRALEGVRPSGNLGHDASDWLDYLRVLELPPGLLTDADPSDFQVVVERLDGEPSSTGMTFDHDGDCGIFNVATLEAARGRGLASSVVASLLGRAAARGCTTATLQSTELARGVYSRQGFQEVGRILEHGPPVAHG
jgi:ribosomal protein S18 acetylase RimI-like enzyme